MSMRGIWYVVYSAIASRPRFDSSQLLIVESWQGIFGLQCVPYCSGGQVRSGAREYIISMCTSGVLVPNAFPSLRWRLRQHVLLGQVGYSTWHPHCQSSSRGRSRMLVSQTIVSQGKSNHVLFSAYNAPGHRGVSPCGVFSTLIYKTRTGGNTCQCHCNQFGIDANVFAFRR